MISTTIWGLNKGFDLSDEGSYLLGYQPEQELGARQGYYHIVVRKTFSFIELNVVNVRIIRLVLTILGSVILSAGVNMWFKTKNYIYFLPFILVGNFLSYCFGPPSLSYNTITGFIVMASLGFVLYASADINIPKNARLLLFFLSGVLLSFQIITKITTAPFQLVLLLIVITVLYKTNKKVKTLSEITLVFGMLMGSLVYSTFYQNYLEFLKNFIYGASIATKSGDGHNLTYYLSDSFITIVKILKFVIISIVLVKLLELWKRSRIHHTLTGSIFQLLTATILLYFFFHYYFIVRSESDISSAFLALTTISILSIINTCKINDFIKPTNIRNNILLLLILLVEPFVASIGTNNTLLSNTTLYLGFWFAVIFVNEFGQSERFIIIFISIISGIYFFLFGYVIEPYRTPCLYLQNSRINNLSRAKNIYVDKNTKEYVEMVRDALIENGFKKGDPIITMFGLPGLVYLMGGISPGSILFSDKQYTLFLNNLTNTPYDVNESYIIVKNTFSKYFEEQLQAPELSFPKNYVESKTITIEDKVAIKIYIPKNKVLYNNNISTAPPRAGNIFDR
jgi:hypothetical protein